MRELLLFAALAVGSTQAAVAEPLDQARYEAVMKTALAYAADQTLINYCLRGLGNKGPNLYFWAHDNLQQAIQRLKAAGADPLQVEGLARIVMANTRFFAADAKDAALQPQCTTKQVEQNAAMMMGVGVPLIMRPPFNDLPR